MENLLQYFLSLSKDNIYIYTYIYIHTHTHIYIYTHTYYTHTQKESNLAQSTAIVEDTRFSRLAEYCCEKAEVLLLQQKIMYFQERVGLITLQKTTSPGKAQKF